MGMTDGTIDGIPNTYLTYGYDEFGNDLYDDLLEEGIPNPYSRHGEGQPFGYTGYQPDRISGTCYAQAREYMPENGRFGAVDKVKGNIMVPETLNEYGYCLGNPLILVDMDGKTPISLVGPIGIGRYKDINNAYSFVEENREKIQAGIQQASEFVEDVGKTIQNGWNAVSNKVSYIWNNYIYGEDTIKIVEGPEITGPFTYGKEVFTETQHKGENIIVYQNTTGTINSQGFTIGIPKIFNVGGTIGTDGLNISAYLGVEDVFEIYGNLNIGSSSIVEFDGKEKIGINGQKAGYGVTFGASPESDVKAYVFSEILDDNGVNRYNEIGIHIKTEVVYELAIIFSLPESAIAYAVAYISELLGITAGAFNNCNM